MAKFVTLVGGVSTLTQAATAGGVSNANNIPQLDANGRLTSDMMPNAIGADSATVNASEALAAGDFVNIYDNGGTPACRKADASNSGKEAFGYVLAAVASGAAATIFFDDSNTGVTGQTTGAVFLSATQPGKATSVVPSASGNIVQRLGVAVSPTNVHVSLGTVTVLA